MSLATAAHLAHLSAADFEREQHTRPRDSKAATPPAVADDGEREGE